MTGTQWNSKKAILNDSYEFASTAAHKEDGKGKRKNVDLLAELVAAEACARKMLDGHIGLCYTEDIDWDN
jgi:hypothetical protein